jgi:hypothetical protein
VAGSARQKGVKGLHLQRRYDPTQVAQYPVSLDWMLQKMDRFRVFAPRVRELSFSPASEGPDEPDGEVGGEAAIEP